jgi:hypothetical protein
LGQTVTVDGPATAVSVDVLHELGDHVVAQLKPRSASAVVVATKTL